MLCEIRGAFGHFFNSSRGNSNLIQGGAETNSQNKERSERSWEGNPISLALNHLDPIEGRGNQRHVISGVGSSFITTAPGPRSDSNRRTCHSSLGSARKIRRFQLSGINVVYDRRISVDRRSDRFFPRTTRHDPVLSTSRGIGGGARASRGWDARETKDTLFLHVDVPADPVPVAVRSSLSSCPTEATTWA
ncbi:hypothetical protein VNO77_03727 [Canavalia gladiata]|uniref:Uncharacterized protein n=1 Tax=Canavalia gladiata TaxID=3824 RepID=A0AAN9R743_CANGL